MKVEEINGLNLVIYEESKQGHKGKMPHKKH